MAKKKAKSVSLAGTEKKKPTKKAGNPFEKQYARQKNPVLEKKTAKKKLEGNVVKARTAALSKVCDFLIFSYV